MPYAAVHAVLWDAALGDVGGAVGPGADRETPVAPVAVRDDAQAERRDAGGPAGAGAADALGTGQEEEEGGFTFFLGTDRIHWLASAGVPLFVSARWLRPRRSFPKAAAPWALDSGGFTEIDQHGRYQTSAWVYAREVRGWAASVGGMLWASVQDWMCEPAALARTGLSVRQHQRLTIDSYVELSAFAPDVPWLPVLQGWERADYLDHVRQYASFGLDLRRFPLVGLGSVCRRQDTAMAEELIRELAGAGLRLHAFGFKLAGLRRVAHLLGSADSMAWSYGARKRPPLPGCTHARCNHCLRYALLWRERALRSVRLPKQATLF